MSNDVVIQVDAISKRYRLGVVGTGTLSHDLNRWWAQLRSKPDPYLKIGQKTESRKLKAEIGEKTEITKAESRNNTKDKNKFQLSAFPISALDPDDPDFVWALRDVSFEVKRGEVLGIIGRNGAGKSTLLKILSRVTAPTTGQIRVKGRIASLLEVGTGFHPELTGKENIFLNGAILGMTKAEIRAKLDEIIAFAEIAKFIDTPVKRYSSGMYVRLAFAVAAHLDPEILIVDEVLAVGDAEFQKKCLGKMQDVAEQGRTVFFVSHNMGMITSLCSRALLLNNGRVATDGPVSETVLHYYGQSKGSPYSIDFRTSGKKVGDDHATLLHAEITDKNRKPAGEMDIRSSFILRMTYELHLIVSKPPYANFHMFDAQGNYVFVAIGNDSDRVCTVPGVYLAECIVPGSLLNNGVYFVGIALTFTHCGFHVSFFEKDALSVNIRDPIDETLNELRSGYSGPIPGPIRPKLTWNIKRL